MVKAWDSAYSSIWDRVWCMWATPGIKLIALCLCEAGTFAIGSFFGLPVTFLKSATKWVLTELER